MKSAFTSCFRYIVLIAVCVFALYAAVFPCRAQALDMTNIQLDHFYSSSSSGLTMAGADYDIAFQACDKTTGKPISDLTFELRVTFPDGVKKTHTFISGTDGQYSCSIPGAEMISGGYHMEIYGVLPDTGEEQWFSLMSFSVFNSGEAHIEAHLLNEEGKVTDEYVVGDPFIIEIALQMRTEDGSYIAYDGNWDDISGYILLQVMPRNTFISLMDEVETPSPGVYRVTIDPNSWPITELVPGDTLSLFARNGSIEVNYTSYICGDKISFPVVATPTPQWAVTFDDGIDDTAETVVSVRDGSLVSQPEDPEREGYRFLGWYRIEDDSLTSDPWDFSTPITGDLTLVAQWEKLPTSVDDEEDPETEDTNSGIHTDQNTEEKPDSSSDVGNTDKSAHKGSNELPATGDSGLLAVAFGAIGASCVALGTISRRDRGGLW